MRILALVTDAFGGFGGISVYNRDLLTALCSLPGCCEVVALPRIPPTAAEPLPQQLRFLTAAAGSKVTYIGALVKLIAGSPAFDLIVSGHINLLPPAFIARQRRRAPILLAIHGIDAWQPTASRFVNLLAKRVDRIASVSDYTRRRFLRWAPACVSKVDLLPNVAHTERFGLGPRCPDLLQRYGLQDRRVLLTVGRLDATERYKGVDEILESLPDLARAVPDLAYLVVGDGTDRPRLEQKAWSLGVGHRVRFAGRIDDTEKADHYRLADAFVMPGRGEGFGIVFLEAMACGIPVVASSLDGSREAVRNGQLGLVVNPEDRAALQRAVLDALNRPKAIPKGLDYFSYPRFRERLEVIIERCQRP